MNTFLKNCYSTIADYVVKFIGKIEWPTSKRLTEQQCNDIRNLLGPNYYIILTRRSNHLSTYLIGLAHFFMTGKFGYWSHALMNLEDEVASDSDFRLVEAVGVGIKYSDFNSVFSCQSAVLLKPKNLSIEDWTAILDKAKSEVGKPYDTLFDLASDDKLSCVELVRSALMADPDYYKKFSHFEQLINEDRNLTPQTFYDCDDFEVVYEAKV